jgi:hypothetical protein
MPRKPKPPPAILKVEGLSDGRAGLVDDFTGEPISEPDAGPRESAVDVQAAGHRQAIADKRAMLQQIGLIPSEPKLVPPNIPGKRAIGRIKLKDGTEMAILAPKNPIRRI